MDPSTQLPRAHRSRRAVDDARERRLVAAGEARVELEVAPRRGVHDERLVPQLARQGSDVRKRTFLRVARVLEKRTRGTERDCQVLAAEAREILGAELRGERPQRRVGEEMPGRTLDGSAH